MMEKKAKIIATLGPAIYSEKKLKKIISLGVDAFRINFSHDIKEVKQIISQIRKLENKLNKRIAIIADLQGVKLRIGKTSSEKLRIKRNQKFTFDTNKKVGNNLRVCFPYPFIINKIKIGNKILLDDGKFTFKVIKKNKKSLVTRCLSTNCILSSNKSVHIPNITIPLKRLTKKDKKDISTAKSMGCNWIALSYIQNSSLIKETRKLINSDIGIISKIENKIAIKNIKEIINASDAIMIARGDLAIDIGLSEVPSFQLELIKKCAALSKPVIVATQMLESMIENPSPTRAEINDIATAIFQGADAVMLSAESAIGKNPTQSVKTMSKTILSSEKYKKQHISEFKSSIDAKKNIMKSVVLSVKDLAYNPRVKGIIAFSNSGKTAKFVSSMRPSVSIITISPNVNVSRGLSLLWGVKSINSRDARNWNDMIEISKEIIAKEKSIKKKDYVVITAGLPFGKAKMTNMIRLYEV